MGLMRQMMCIKHHIIAELLPFLKHDNNHERVYRVLSSLSQSISYEE